MADISEHIDKFANGEIDAGLCVRLMSRQTSATMNSVVQQKLSEISPERAMGLKMAANSYDAYHDIKEHLKPLEGLIKRYNKKKATPRELVRGIWESSVIEKFDKRELSMRTLVDALIMGGKITRGQKNLSWITNGFDIYLEIKDEIDERARYFINKYQWENKNPLKFVQDIGETKFFQKLVKERQMDMTTVVEALLVGGEIDEENSTRLGWVASHYSTFQDIWPYFLDSEKITQVMKKYAPAPRKENLSEENIFRWCHDMDRLNILLYINKKTGRSIGLTLLFDTLVTGGALPEKKAFAVGAYERSKAQVLIDIFGKSNNPGEFAEKVKENWTEIRKDYTLRATYKGEPKKEPWSYEYCRFIYKALQS